MCCLRRSLVCLYLFVCRSGTMAAMSTKETVGRIFGSSGHDFDPLYFYFIVVLPGLLPWTFLLPWALYKRFRMLEPSRLRTFLEVWFVFVFAFFSLCAIKKPQYVVMLSCVFAAWLGNGRHRHVARVFRPTGYGPYCVAICLSGSFHCGSVQRAFVAFKKPAGYDSGRHGQWVLLS